MIIVLKPGSTESELDHILLRIEQLGFKAHLSRGVQRTIIGLIGDEEQLRAEPLTAIEGSAMPYLSAPFCAHSGPQQATTQSATIARGKKGRFRYITAHVTCFCTARPGPIPRHLGKAPSIPAAGRRAIRFAHETTGL